VFYFCIFSNKLDLLKATCSIIVTLRDRNILIKIFAAVIYTLLELANVFDIG